MLRRSKLELVNRFAEFAGERREFCAGVCRFDGLLDSSLGYVANAGD